MASETPIRDRIKKTNRLEETIEERRQRMEKEARMKRTEEEGRVEHEERLKLVQAEERMRERLKEVVGGGSERQGG